MKVPDLNIPPGLEEAYFRAFSFGSKNTQNTIRQHKLAPARRLFSYFARRSYFVQMEPDYDLLTEQAKKYWQQYWAWLPFASQSGYQVQPGSGFSAFVYENKTLHRNKQPLILEAPYSDFWYGVSPFSYSGFQYLGRPSYTRLAQQYNCTSNKTLKKIAIGIEIGLGTPTDNLILNIYRGGTNPENGTKIAGPFSIPFQNMKIATIPNGPTFFEFSPNISLTSGQTYYFVFSRSGTLSNSNYAYCVTTFKSKTGLTYPPSRMWSRSSTSWSSSSSYDLFYLLY